MAEEVLEGLKGVVVVNSGYRDPYETNTVWYDPGIITIQEIENALKKAHVYLGTVEPDQK